VCTPEPSRTRWSNPGRQRYNYTVRRWISWILLAAGAFAPAAGVAAQVKSGSLELRLLEAPSARRDDPRARIYIIDHLAPGDSISRKIGLTNNSNTTLRVALYSGAAEVANGRFVPLAGSGGNDVAGWTTISPSAVDARPSEEATATVTIAVPPDAAPGEHYGVAWAQLPQSTPKGGGPSEVNRVGIRIYLSVGPGGEPASDFVIDSLVAQRTTSGTPVVVARVRNTGGRALDMNGSLRLEDGPGGLNAGPFPARLGTTLGIEQSEPVTVALDKQVPDGPWKATMTLRSGLVERSATATIRFPHGRGAADPVAVDRPSSGLLRYVLYALGVLVVLGLLLSFLWRRRLRPAHPTRGSAVTGFEVPTRDDSGPSV
jgi:hypothetical protein